MLKIKMPEIIRLYLFVAGWSVHALKRAVLIHFLQSLTHLFVYSSIRSNYLFVDPLTPPEKFEIFMQLKFQRVIC